jgi:hypothetical protein
MKRHEEIRGFLRHVLGEVYPDGLLPEDLAAEARAVGIAWPRWSTTPIVDHLIELRPREQYPNGPVLPHYLLKHKGEVAR